MKTTRFCYIVLRIVELRYQDTRGTNLHHGGSNIKFSLSSLKVPTKQQEKMKDGFRFRGGSRYDYLYGINEVVLSPLYLERNFIRVKSHRWVLKGRVDSKKNKQNLYNCHTTLNISCRLSSISPSLNLM
ncbi:hypothetical protein RclHR1_07960009 [Rhizophagus clarus]|uniref:Uncharacterized protein n=1 Tax=Rhizophagus clarus TaxID=94130 RepID=A0A2Z6S5M4_9GLOM|nr:hypothetical protein RclHR1_07960009 [Rhizophagus clarus]